MRVTDYSYELYSSGFLTNIESKMQSMICAKSYYCHSSCYVVFVSKRLVTIKFYIRDGFLRVGIELVEVNKVKPDFKSYMREIVKKIFACATNCEISNDQIIWDVTSDIANRLGIANLIRSKPLIGDEQVKYANTIKKNENLSVYNTNTIKQQ